MSSTLPPPPRANDPDHVCISRRGTNIEGGRNCHSRRGANYKIRKYRQNGGARGCHLPGGGYGPETIQFVTKINQKNCNPIQNQKSSNSLQPDLQRQAHHLGSEGRGQNRGEQDVHACKDGDREGAKCKSRREYGKRMQRTRYLALHPNTCGHSKYQEDHQREKCM